MISMQGKQCVRRIWSESDDTARDGYHHCNVSWATADTCSSQGFVSNVEFQAVTKWQPLLGNTTQTSAACALGSSSASQISFSKKVQLQSFPQKAENPSFGCCLKLLQDVVTIYNCFRRLLWSLLFHIKPQLNRMLKGMRHGAHAHHLMKVLKLSAQKWHIVSSFTALRRRSSEICSSKHSFKVKLLGLDALFSMKPMSGVTRCESESGAALCCAC